MFKDEIIIYADCVLSRIVRHTLHNAAHFTTESVTIEIRSEISVIANSSLAAACCLAAQVCCALVSGILNTVNIYMFTKQLQPKRRRSLLSFYVKLA